jgi:hypothetical protein
MTNYSEELGSKYFKDIVGADRERSTSLLYWICRGKKNITIDETHQIRKQNFHLRS